MAMTMRFYNTSGTATTSSATITISDGVAFAARSLWLKNDGGTNSLFFSLKGADATAASFELKPGESKSYQYDAASGGDGWSRVDVITAASTTAYRLESMR